VARSRMGRLGKAVDALSCDNGEDVRLSGEEVAESPNVHACSAAHDAKYAAVVGNISSRCVCMHLHNILFRTAAYLVLGQRTTPW
jgi:hypothetical protein